LVLETKHEADYTRRWHGGQTDPSGGFLGLPWGPADQPISRRTNAAPPPSASSFAPATSRESGTMPQLAHGWIRSGGTCFIAARTVAAASCGVSTRSVATSIAPTSTSLPSRSAISSRGTCEFAHSRETWSIPERASSGNVFSYCLHSEPSVFFHSML